MLKLMSSTFTPDDTLMTRDILCAVRNGLDFGNLAAIGKIRWKKTLCRECDMRPAQGNSTWKVPCIYRRFLLFRCSEVTLVGKKCGDIYTYPYTGSLKRARGEPRCDCVLEISKEEVVRLDAQGLYQGLYQGSIKDGTIRDATMVPPRRLWDLEFNRVVFFHGTVSKLCRECFDSTENPPLFEQEYSAISHSWVEDLVTKPQYHNWFDWPIPSPSNACIDLIRGQLWEEFGIEYCWVDVLCLRQRGDSIDEDQRMLEWQIDVPTIGNVYRNAKSVVRYFNGLGLPMETDHKAWENPKHWKNRAWTMQEIRPEDEMIDAQPYPPAGATMDLLLRLQAMVPLNTFIEGTNSQKTIRQVLQPISELSLAAHSEEGCSIIRLAAQMSQRFSSNPVDKIAGINYLMWPKGARFDLPIYEENLDIETAWLRCVASMRRDLKVELLFLYPYPRQPQAQEYELDTGLAPLLNRGECTWIPAWAQIQNLPSKSINDVWEGLPLSVLSSQVYPNPRNPFYVRTYMWNLNEVLGTLVFDNCEIKHWGSGEYKVSLQGQDKVAAFYALEESESRFVSPPFYTITSWLWNKSGDQYVMLCLSLEMNLPWVVCRTASMMGLGEFDKEVRKSTGYERILFLEKVTTLRTDERLKISRILMNSKRPIKPRHYDAVYII